MNGKKKATRRTSGQKSKQHGGRMAGVEYPDRWSFVQIDVAMTTVPTAFRSRRQQAAHLGIS